MREILFRGKIEQSIYEPIAKNGWIFGNYIECLDDHWRNIDENGNDISETRPMIFTIIESKGMKQHIRIPIIPKTLGQYTGIDDINGDKIFEGDIVSFGTEAEMYEMFREVLGLVVYESTRFRIRWFWWNYMHDKFILKETHDLNKYIEKDGSKCLKIFGNMTDNPELLGESK